MDCDDSDILRLARIQGRYHLVDPASEVSAASPTNYVLSQSSYASVIRRNREEHQTVQNRRTNCRTAPNYRHDNRDKSRKKDDVIAGSGRNFSLQCSFPQCRAKYRECVGVFVSRLHKDTRVRHVKRHVLNVTGLHVRCEPIPTKYGTYASYCIPCSTKNTKQLLDSEMWPYNLIV